MNTWLIYLGRFIYLFIIIIVIFIIINIINISVLAGWMDGLIWMQTV